MSKFDYKKYKELILSGNEEEIEEFENEYDLDYGNFYDIYTNLYLRCDELIEELKGEK